MIETTEELIDQLAKEYKQVTRNYVRDEIIQSVKENCIGLHIDEKDAIKFLGACLSIYYDGYHKGKNDWKGEK